MSLESSKRPLCVAVVGAGVAGAACARALCDAGHSVRVFDKSCDAGGRLATRRELWVDALGQGRSTRFDHGAPGFDARSAAFRNFTADALRAGWLKAWLPLFDSRGLGSANPGPTLVPVPDMPTLCRQVLRGIDVAWASPVQRLQRGPLGWSLHGADGVLSEGFDAVVLALPPAQAGQLLAVHQPGWARHAALALMQPCWTLMGVATAPQAAIDWHVARPPGGPLFTVQRNECRPGRERREGEAHWVLHARAAWSRLHLAQSAAWVQDQLQAALADWLGEVVHWHYAVTHRWRYAMPLPGAGDPVGRCWWDPASGLGVCGDFLGGGGVEAAWLSAHALAVEMLAGTGAGTGTGTGADFGIGAVPLTRAAQPEAA